MRNRSVTKPVAGAGCRDEVRFIASSVTSTSAGERQLMAARLSVCAGMMRPLAENSLHRLDWWSRSDYASSAYWFIARSRPVHALIALTQKGLRTGGREEIGKYAPRRHRFRSAHDGGSRQVSALLEGSCVQCRRRPCAGLRADPCGSVGQANAGAAGEPRPMD